MDKTRVINGIEYEVGDRVKFTDYDHHANEYAIRKGQSATIIKLHGLGGDIGIRWDDEKTSGVWASENFWGMHHSDDKEVNKVFDTLKQRTIQEAGQ